jgi:ATP-dependent RNA helicase DDX49/DBP8
MREMYLYYLLTHLPESITHLRRAPPEPQWKKKGKQKAKESTSITADEIVQPPPTIIFTPTARLASYLSLLLQNMKIRSTAMHSRLSQKQRLQSLALFRSFVIPVLVTTDVGARGLDIADVALVVSWDIPQEPETYTHRVGRTARAGKGGIAVAFIGGEEDGTKLGKVEERISQYLPWEIHPLLISVQARGWRK